MSEDAGQEHISKKALVYRIPEMDGAEVRRDVEYIGTGEGALTMDVYYPPDSETGARRPAVVFVAGYPDSGFERIVGCKLKEMASYVSWARLTAAAGLVAITYTNREPESDAVALLNHITENAEGLGVDADRLGLWACSGNVPNALALLMRDVGEHVRCAVLCYGLMLDLGGDASVAEASRQWGFANPCAGKSVEDLPPGVPLFVARAGRDETPHVNETIDRFAAEALRLNLPLTLVNHPAAPHAFDLFDDTETSREIIRQILAFMRFHLSARPASAPEA